MSRLSFKISFLCFMLVFQVFSAWAMNMDSIKALVDSGKLSPDEKVISLNQLSRHFLRTDTIQSLSFANQALELAESNNNVTGVIKSTESLARYYTEQGQYKQAKSFLVNVIEIYNEVDYPREFAAVYITLANIHDIQSEFDLALSYYLKSEKLFVNLDDARGAGLAQMGIANIYNTMENYEDAVENYRKSYKNLLEEAPVSASWSMNNMALSLMAINQNDSALYYFEKSLEMKLKLDDRYGASYTYSDMGTLFEKLHEYNKAISSYEKALEIKLSLEGINPETIGAAYNNIGRLYFIEEQYIGAVQNLKKGLEYAEKSGSLQYQVEAFKYLAKSFSEMGEYKEALKNTELYALFSDSLSRSLHSENLSELKVQYQTEQKELAIIMLNDSIALQDKNLKLQHLEVEREKQKNRLITILLVGAGVIIVLVLGLGWVLYKNNQDKKKANEMLAATNTEISQQKHIIEEKHREITDSINYAERIQRSFLATSELLYENLGEYFVLFKPKDVVSGDFYWAGKLNNGNFSVCCADSTGHGVPGAIMSILNISSIEKAVEQETEPHLILNKTREIIIDRLKKDGSPEGGKDGMDCSFLVLNKETNEMLFAAANNPVIIIRGEEIIEYRGDKMPVGKHKKDQESFTLQKAKLEKGDMVYTLTDGFPDQFGGLNSKKYMIKNLRILLQKIAYLPSSEQQSLLENEFEIWKGNNEQIDDVCIVGFRV